MSDDALAREIKQLREDLRSERAELRSSLGLLLPRELHAAVYEALERRVTAMETKVEALDTKVDDLDDKRQETWLKRVGMVLIPLASLVALIIFSVWKP